MAGPVGAENRASGIISDDVPVLAAGILRSDHRSDPVAGSGQERMLHRFAVGQRSQDVATEVVVLVRRGCHSLHDAKSVGRRGYLLGEDWRVIGCNEAVLSIASTSLLEDRIANLVVDDVGV